jgi:hypothetical protein
MFLEGRLSGIDHRSVVLDRTSVFEMPANGG